MGGGGELKTVKFEKRNVLRGSSPKDLSSSRMGLAEQSSSLDHVLYLFRNEAWRAVPTHQVEVHLRNTEKGNLATCTTTQVRKMYLSQDKYNMY